jgi:hypothetical protein
MYYSKWAIPDQPNLPTQVGKIQLFFKLLFDVLGTATILHLTLLRTVAEWSVA